MRNLLTIVAACLLLAPAAVWGLTLDGDPIEGDSWNQAFVTEYFTVSNPQVEILHLRLNGSTFEPWTDNRGGLQWDFSDDNTFLIGSPASGHIDSEVSMNIRFSGTTATSFVMDWAESYSIGGGHATPYKCGKITWAAGWTESYDYDGGSASCPFYGDTLYDSEFGDDSPEAATWALLLCTGLAGAIGRRRRKPA